MNKCRRGRTKAYVTIVMRSGFLGTNVRVNNYIGFGEGEDEVEIIPEVHSEPIEHVPKVEEKKGTFSFCNLR